jgi:hypothetical protein
MPTRFSPDELRRAIVALATIERDGDQDELDLILRQASDSAPNGSRWGNATPNQRSGGGLLAGRLADLLGEDPDRCEQSAAEVFAPQRHRAIFDALVSYADELSGKPASAPAMPKLSQVRIVADRMVTK